MGKSVILNCSYCGKEFTRAPSKLKSKSGHYFCGKECKDKAQVEFDDIRPKHYYTSKKEKRETCLNCGLKLKKTASIYCNHSCYREYEHKKFIKEWKSNNISGNIGVNSFKVSKHIRDYLFEKHDSQCCKCGWKKINPVTGNVPLQIHHINGNDKDSREDNLELLCPNCHSLTENFMALNSKCTSMV